MAISINYGTKVINVPKSDMTLIQSTPTEIRELNLNTFRLTLKNLEDDEAGMPYSHTHNHNTAVSVGGVQLARVVEILEPYTITFEDGEYAVNLVAANSNVGDRVNLNQVSIRSANSAGLIQTREIEFASFEGEVTIDVVNGFAGTTYPTGTKLKKVNNIADALLIANVRGLNKICIIGDITFTTGDNLDNFIIRGESTMKSTITIDSGAMVTGTEFNNATITGTLDGNNALNNCVIHELVYVEGTIHNCLLGNHTITLGGSVTTTFLNCWSGASILNSQPIINMGGYGRNLIMREWSGGLKITNLTGNNNAVIDMVSGHVIVDSTVSAGTVRVRGVGTKENNSTGTAVVIDDTLSQSCIADSVLDELILDHQQTGSLGEHIKKKVLTTTKFIGLK